MDEVDQMRSSEGKSGQSKANAVPRPTELISQAQELWIIWSSILSLRMYTTSASVPVLRATGRQDPRNDDEENGLPKR